ncbi:acyl-CoA reductase [Persicitalea jodogahamensis]|uniref:Acyl-CoA reductase n=2 Tax=Persicitalea jodogahamensis TaxID=402147 RepID=A0A8J3DCD4_9BACT|nr:acyl-CoA reductase [Persicitalea jodogahamensis]
MARARNGWFVPENTLFSIERIASNYLDEGKLNSFLNQYEQVTNPKKIGVVMAGNVPAVGFHDALCVLLSGHSLLAKLSKDDTPLMFFLLETLKKLEPEFKNAIQIVERINEADAYIATGSDNTARYFEYYFAQKPNIVRKNRTAVAVLDGDESPEELSGLSEDIFRYFGLGCRNVSKLYVPKGYDFSKLYEVIEEKRAFYANHHKYFNNYEYNRSILLVNQTPHFDNGFVMFTESEAMVSPLSVVYYENYEDISHLNTLLENHTEKIQCVVADPTKVPGAVPFGKAQSPGLKEYADGVDTMAFLSSL